MNVRPVELPAGLEPLRKLVEDVAELAEPVPLLAGLRPHVADGRPEAKRPVAHGDDRWAHASALQVAEHGLPALGALAVAILDRDQLLRPVGSHVDHHQRAEAVVLQPDVEMHAIDPHVDVVAVGETTLLEGPVLGFPLGGGYSARECVKRHANAKERPGGEHLHA